MMGMEMGKPTCPMCPMCGCQMCGPTCPRCGEMDDEVVKNPVIEALEQARAALDAVEAAATQGRRDKAKLPPPAVKAKMETEDDYAEMG